MRTIKIVITVFIGIAIVFIYYFFNPAEYFFPPCTFYQTTGLYCPGCGSQRAFHTLLHGNFLTAFRQNLLLPFGLLALTYYTGLQIVRKWLNKPCYNYLQHRYFTWFFVAFTLLYWILRNIPMQLH